MPDSQRSLDELSAETLTLLHKAGVQLALAEAGTGGEVADCLSATNEGRTVLTNCHLYGAAEELASGLRVSPASVQAFGAMSEMVAAEAAADLIDTYEGGWGLVVMAPCGNRAAEPGVPSESAGAQHGFVALGTPSTTIIQQCPPDQTLRTTVELLGEQAERRLRIMQLRASEA